MSFSDSNHSRRGAHNYLSFNVDVRQNKKTTKNKIFFDYKYYFSSSLFIYLPTLTITRRVYKKNTTYKDTSNKVCFRYSLVFKAVHKRPHISEKSWCLRGGMNSYSAFQGPGTKGPSKKWVPVTKLSIRGVQVSPSPKVSSKTLLIRIWWHTMTNRQTSPPKSTFHFPIAKCTKK